MWKKPQTYLIGIATLMTIAMFFCRFAVIITPGGGELEIMYYEKLPYVVMLIMLMTAGISAFFCHSQPLLQARVCIISVLMLVGFQIWLGVDYFRFRNDMVFSPTMLFPFVAAILETFAARKALVDGMTLQAVQSIRKKGRK